jgi:hypothetical protein
MVEEVSMALRIVIAWSLGPALAVNGLAMLAATRRYILTIV